jgi:phosphatidate cytidylyltransferase
MTWQRVLTALVLIPVVVAMVLFAPTWAVAVATAGITVLALREYFDLGAAIGHRAYRLWTIGCAMFLVFQQFLGSFDPSAAIPGRTTFRLAGHDLAAFPSPGLSFFLFVLGVACLTLTTKRPLVESLPAAGISSSALLLVAFPLSFAVRLHGFHEQGPRVLLFALALIWASDTVAYFTGRAIGKHPLAHKISPKKTWEGSIAGMFGSFLVVWAFHYWLVISLPHLLAMGAVGNVAGQIGDLLESAYKRSAGVKDSGALLPGHGGVLDRIDALILSIPVIWYYLVLVNPHL